MTGKTLSHYVVMDKIGAGGMGEVYRARDLHLERDVALKILPAGYLTEETARKRFRAEALALSKLNHPNIATVFDFDTDEGVDFLAMELVRGMPLDERLKAGPLPERDVVRLGLQLAEGLAAAHAEGVIHRDLKPGNLMVTAEGRLKILDFGLALLVRSDDDADLTRSFTEHARVVGTLPYMSPEQLRGVPGDARSDIYGAGAVLYELAAGQRPFSQSQSNELVGAILHQTPAPLRSRNDRTTAGLERVVTRALGKEPSERYQSARELLVALEGLGIGAPAAKHPRLGRRVVAAGVIGASLLGGFAIVLNLAGTSDLLGRRRSGEDEGTSPSSTTVRVRRSVAVLGFKNLSGRQDAAWLSTALSEMLTTELAAGEQLRTVPGEGVAQMRINLALPDAESYGKDTLAKIRDNLNADDVVLGSYLTMADGQVRLDLRLQDAMAGETLAAVSERGTVANLDDLISRAGLLLRAKLGAGRVSAVQAMAVKATRPSNPDAVKFYAEGLAKLRVFDNLSARDLLTRAVAADPDHALAHSALATAWTVLGYDEKAKSEAKRAFELSAKLSREDQLTVEGKYRETTAEREKATEIYRTLRGFFPDNLDYGLLLAAAQTAAGKGRDALASVEALRPPSTPQSADPRIDLAEAIAAESVSDFTRQQVAAERAVARGSAQGARLLVARAQISEGTALRRRGELEKAILVYERARETFTGVGDRGGVSIALGSLGAIFGQRGEFSKAEAFHTQALAIRREIGDARGVASSLNSLAIVRTRQDDLPSAKQLFEDSLRIRREINDRPGIATNLNNLGAVLNLQGDVIAARRMYEESLVINREIGEKRMVAMSLGNIALLLERQADLAGAMRMNDEALAIQKEIGDKSSYAQTLANSSYVLWVRGDVPGAQKRLEEALAIQADLGEKLPAARTRLSIASALIEQGQAARAEALAREAATQFRTEKATGQEAHALRVLADALLTQGILGDARQSIDKATELLARSDDRGDRLSAQTMTARVRAASGDSARARQILEGVLAEAVRFQFVATEFEARLALGEIEMRAGMATAGRTRLAALERDAAAKDFLLVARKARAAAVSAR